MKVILELEKVAEAEESDEIRDFLIKKGRYYLMIVLILHLVLRTGLIKPNLIFS